MTSTALPRAALVAVLALTLGACGSDEPSQRAASDTRASAPAPVENSATPPAGEPFGPGCASLPAEGEGSPAGMADDPVGRAAASNPALSTLVQALTTANLGPSLDAQEAITVLAPANPAFEAVPPEELQALMADTARLTAVLTHHVIAGRIPPEQLAGTHTTLNNDEVTIEGDGETFTVPGTLTGTPATVVCGNVQTANATVYLVDQVLTPAS